MKFLRYLTIAAAVGLATAASSATVQAQQAQPAGGAGLAAGPVVTTGGSCSTCGHGKFDGRGLFSRFGGAPPQPTTLFGGHNGQHGLFHHQKPQLPVFQAAPWYNYWPYDGHFQTPAPINGPFYGPPQTGNFPVNPYFPAGFQGWGPIPGGPPPGFPGMQAPPAMQPPGFPPPVVPGGGFGR